MLCHVYDSPPYVSLPKNRDANMDVASSTDSLISTRSNSKNYKQGLLPPIQNRDGSSCRHLRTDMSSGRKISQFRQTSAKKQKRQVLKDIGGSEKFQDINKLDKGRKKKLENTTAAFFSGQSKLFKGTSKTSSCAMSNLSSPDGVSTEASSKQGISYEDPTEEMNKRWLKIV